MLLAVYRRRCCESHRVTERSTRTTNLRSTSQVARLSRCRLHVGSLLAAACRRKLPSVVRVSKDVHVGDVLLHLLNVLKTILRIFFVTDICNYECFRSNYCIVVMFLLVVVVLVLLLVVVVDDVDDDDGKSAGQLQLFNDNPVLGPAIFFPDSMGMKTKY